MGAPRPTHNAAFVAFVSFVTSLSLAAGTAHAVMPPLFDEGVEINDAAARTLKSKFACVTRRGAPDKSQLRVVVTTSRARHRAERLIDDLGVADIASVRVVSPRFSHLKFEAIEKTLAATAPVNVEVHRAQNFRLMTSPGGARPCMPVWVTVPTPEAAGHADAFAWAKAQEQTYGADRVEVHVGARVFAM
jgi:hypothetical protein